MHYYCFVVTQALHSTIAQKKTTVRDFTMGGENEFQHSLPLPRQFISSLQPDNHSFTQIKRSIIPFSNPYSFCCMFIILVGSKQQKLCIHQQKKKSFSLLCSLQLWERVLVCRWSRICVVLVMTGRLCRKIFLVGCFCSRNLVEFSPQNWNDKFLAKNSQFWLRKSTCSYSK